MACGRLAKGKWDLWAVLGLLALLSFPVLLGLTQIAPSSPISQFVEHGAIFGVTTEIAYQTTMAATSESTYSTVVTSSRTTYASVATSTVSRFTSTQVTTTSTSLTTSFATTTTTSTEGYPCHPYPECQKFVLVPVPGRGYGLGLVLGNSVTRIPPEAMTLIFVTTVLGFFIVYERRNTILSWF
jgi:hypothetical protein